ncbi:hypothetical protein [Porphyromonas cangingivalis]|uniref:hypothetical protein n=1 Tax=Porphyromonas cangingivalis TaxID=36874 RepID=UPI00051D32A5|nr:hypothetical protein [Porphyromonas cangingivalis]KGL50048.1 hypothetical protein HQ34_01600 [Porphyromonas cangingivalis]
MKRKLTIALSLLAVCTGVALASARYKTTCGKWFMGPEQTFFEEAGDWFGYMSDMNQALCGGGKIHKVLEKCNESGTYIILR